MNEYTSGDLYGYVRVSARDQNEDRQLIALENFEIPKGHIFIDKQSGKDFNRPAYLHLMNTIKENDLIIIKSIDRLGRDYEEIMDQWRIITREKKSGHQDYRHAALRYDTMQGFVRYLYIRFGSSGVVFCIGK